MSDRKQPESIVEADLLAIKLAGERVRRATAELRAAEAEHAQMVEQARQLQADIAQRYDLRQGDQFNIADGQIERSNGASAPTQQHTE
jgi:hypothetical protein